MIVTSYKELKIPAEPMENEGPRAIEELRAALEAELSKHQDGAGLAAPQIGIRKRVILLRDVETGGYDMFINPKIVESTGDRIPLMEGCLSFPGMKVLTRRYPQVTVEDVLHGSAVYTDFEAVVLQHEIDHLDGVLFFERGVIVEPRFDRNSPCFCGSGRKFKKCHG